MTDNTSANLFRKKPVVISAVQFTKAMAEGHESLPEGVVMASRTTDATGHFPEYANDGKYLTNYDTCHRHCIATLEGQMDVRIGDWVITGVQGEHYPCKPDIFEQTYEPALPTPAPTMVDERGEDILQFAPQFSGVSSPEPTLERIIWRYYLSNIHGQQKAQNYAAAYVDALRTALATRPSLQSLGGDAGVSEAMVDAYLQANDAYWKRTDQLPTPPDKWRTGTPREATRESLRAALSLTSTEKSDGGVKDALRTLVEQIEKCMPVDDHGHDFTLNRAFLRAKEML